MLHLGCRNSGTSTGRLSSLLDALIYEFWLCAVDDESIRMNGMDFRCFLWLSIFEFCFWHTLNSFYFNLKSIYLFILTWFDGVALCFKSFLGISIRIQLFFVYLLAKKCDFISRLSRINSHTTISLVYLLNPLIFFLYLIFIHPKMSNKYLNLKGKKIEKEILLMLYRSNKFNKFTKSQFKVVFVTDIIIQFANRTLRSLTTINCIWHWWNV